MTPQEQEDHKVRADMKKFGRFCDSQLPYGWGFVFLAFPFGAGGRMNYIANANRADVVRAMYEFIEQSKAGWDRHHAEPDSAAEDEQLARARQRVAELEGLLQEATEVLQRADQQITELERLVSQAAEALATAQQGGNMQTLWYSTLLDELRKAVE